MLTPYQFASNRPIDGIDLDGAEWKSKKDANGSTKSGENGGYEFVSEPTYSQSSQNVTFATYSYNDDKGKEWTRVYSTEFKEEKKADGTLNYKPYGVIKTVAGKLIWTELNQGQTAVVGDANKTLASAQLKTFKGYANEDWGNTDSKGNPMLYNGITVEFVVATPGNSSMNTSQNVVNTSYSQYSSMKNPFIDNLGNVTPFYYSQSDIVDYNKKKWISFQDNPGYTNTMKGGFSWNAMSTIYAKQGNVYKPILNFSYGFNYSNGKITPTNFKIIHIP